MLPLILAIAAAQAAPSAPQSVDPREKYRPEDTEYYAPVPRVVRPGEGSWSVPPADAVVLIGAKGMEPWLARDGSPAPWLRTPDGAFQVPRGAKYFVTRRSFSNFQLHLEWRESARVIGDGQTRGNSGLFLAFMPSMSYELQILDSWNNPTYVNGQAGSVYKQSPPLVNPIRPPGQWQSYDVVWHAPQFNSDGSVRRKARITAFFNGVLVQDNFELAGSTEWRGPPAYTPHGALPIALQNHGDPSDPVSFRNMWLREIP